MLDKYTGNRLPQSDTSKEGGKFVFCSSNEEHFQWVKHALNSWPIMPLELAAIDAMTVQIARYRPQLVLLDFSGNCRNTQESCAQEMLALAQTLKLRSPDTHLVAVGSGDYPEGAVAAMRAGVHHFINMQAEDVEARDVIRTMITGLPGPAAETCTMISLLGARPGIGTTTLAVHLADILQQRKTVQRSTQRIAFLDLGLPAGDGQLYLNVSGNFDFIEAVRNRHRLDDTLIQTALAHSRSGVKIVSLPRAPGEMRGVAPADAVALLTQLRQFFDVLIIDLGGFSDADFVSRIANASDQAWLLTDQSVGSLVSLDMLIKDLDRNQVAHDKRYLVVNRHDTHYGMSAMQIADRFKLRLKAILPASATRLIAAANLGKLLHEEHRSDPYVQSITQLADNLLRTNVDRRQRSGVNSWIGRYLPQLVRKQHA